MVYHFVGKPHTLTNCGAVTWNVERTGRRTNVSQLNRLIAKRLEDSRASGSGRFRAVLAGNH